jgi:predicted site-specific integrase-resolvase
MVVLDGDLAAITWTTNQAAEAAGVQPGRIRIWAHRGKLQAVNPRSKHPRYPALDVLRVEAEMNGRLPVAA